MRERERLDVSRLRATRFYTNRVRSSPPYDIASLGFPLSSESVFALLDGLWIKCNAHVRWNEPRCARYYIPMKISKAPRKEYKKEREREEALCSIWILPRVNVSSVKLKPDRKFLPDELNLRAVFIRGAQCRYRFKE